MVVYNHNGVEYNVDGYLAANLDALKEDAKKDMDAFLIIDGGERQGKSFLAHQIACYLDPTYTLDRTCFSAKQFHQVVRASKDKYQCVIFDEAFGSLASRSAMSYVNKQLIKVMSEMGFKNMFAIICLPSFFELDRYPAIHRSTGLLNVYQRGMYSSYDYEKKKSLYLFGKKGYNYHITQPNYRGRFSNVFPLDKEDYLKRKAAAVLQEDDNTGYSMRAQKQGRQRNDLIRWLVDMGYTYNQIAARMGCTKENISMLITADAKDKAMEKDMRLPEGRPRTKEVTKDEPIA